MCIQPFGEMAGFPGMARRTRPEAENVQQQTTIGSKQDPAPGWGYAQQEALKINNQIQNQQTPNTNQGGLKGDDTIQTKKDISGGTGGSGGGGINY